MNTNQKRSTGKSSDAKAHVAQSAADLIQEIAAASGEQTTGVNQINSAIGQVSQTLTCCLRIFQNQRA